MGAFGCFSVRKGRLELDLWMELGQVQLWFAGGEALLLGFLKGMLRGDE